MKMLLKLLMLTASFLVLPELHANSKEGRKASAASESVLYVPQAKDYENTPMANSPLFFDLVDFYELSYGRSYLEQGSDTCSVQSLVISEILNEANLLKCEMDFSTYSFCSELILYAQQKDWFLSHIDLLSDKKFRTLEDFDLFEKRSQLIQDLLEVLTSLEDRS